MTKAKKIVLITFVVLLFGFIIFEITVFFSFKNNIKVQEQQIAQLEQQKKEIKDKEKNTQSENTLQKEQDVQPTQTMTEDTQANIENNQKTEAVAQPAVNTTYEESVRKFSGWCDAAYYSYKKAGHDLEELRTVDDCLIESYRSFEGIARILPEGSAERAYTDRCYNALIKGSNMLKDGVDFNTAMADYHAIPEWGE